MSETAPAPTTRRQVLLPLSGLLLAMFSAFLSSTIVSNALPTIIADLDGSQRQYTWVVVATLLASTATTPLWGKTADLVDKKVLVQVATLVFTVGSVGAGLAPSVELLIAWRAVQGLGLGGLQALVIIVVAAMISPRERGRYMGPIGAVMSVAPVVGPLLGGVIVDSPLGWRWCFFVGVPLSLASLLLVQRTLHLPLVRRPVRIDYLGAALIVAAVSDLLVWVTLAGDSFAWGSATSWAMGLGGLALVGLAVLAESRAAEPVIPLRLFRDRTTTLATLASIAVGVAMFGGSVFLGQYFQVARGYSPTAAGLLSLPMVLGSTVSSVVSGQLISRTGRWKVFLVLGGTLMTAGFGLLATLDHETPMGLVFVYLALLGTGMGMMMQNLVLAVQNTVHPSDLGTASSTVSFFRSLGGTVGVSVLGVVLADRVAVLVREGLVAIGVDAPAGGAGVGIGGLEELPAPVEEVVRAAYGDATGRIFFVAAVLAVLGLLAILCIREVPLRTLTGAEQLAEEQAAAAAAEAGAGGTETSPRLPEPVGPARR
ncbi:MFS transporter [Aquipuribacter hungaricus]|uniref:MFS transporter n=1 Tax=Aquipuribacter hungaricus TaxID=545624 RepID=A0ABV7WJJ1_9MICO